MKDYLQGLDDQRAFLADQDRRARMAALRHTSAPIAAPARAPAATTTTPRVYDAPAAVTVLPRPAAPAIAPAAAGQPLATVQCHIRSLCQGLPGACPRWCS